MPFVFLFSDLAPKLSSLEESIKQTKKRINHLGTSLVVPGGTFGEESTLPVQEMQETSETSPGGGNGNPLQYVK